MREPVALIVRWLPLATTFIGVISLLFGAWSALAPRRSIALYQWIMAHLNWRVSPIDEPREILTTRLFGSFLIVLSLALFWCLR